MLGKRVLLIMSVVLNAIFAVGCDQNQISATPRADETDLCNFHQGPCTVSVGDNIISLELAPNDAPSEKPLTFKLKLSNAPTKLDSRIEGRDMFMGVIPVNWSETGENTFQASAIYGSCSSDYMIWRLWLSITDKEGNTQQTWFDFKADNSR